MNKELYVSTTPHETKVALVEDDQLAEVYFERENEYTLAGSIYKGRVTRVLPGMQSAFVDIGLERDAFLYVSDFLELQDEDEDAEFGDVKITGNSLIIAEPQVTEEESSEEPKEEAVAESEGSSLPSEGREAGTPRWRGRRRRRGRRGGRDRMPADRQVDAQHTAAEPESLAGASLEIEGGSEEELADRESAAAPRKRELRGFEPRGLVVHGLSRTVDESEEFPESEPGFEADGRAEDVSSEDAPAGTRTPMVLPGESISKYNRPEGEESAAAPAAESGSSEDSERNWGRSRGGRGRRGNRGRDRGREPRETESFVLPENYTPIVLPGESISKYRGIEPLAAQGKTEVTAPAGNIAEAEASVSAGQEPIAPIDLAAGCESVYVEPLETEAPVEEVAPDQAAANPDEPLASASYSGVSSLSSMTHRVSEMEPEVAKEPVEPAEKPAQEEVAAAPAESVTEEVASEGPVAEAHIGAVEIEAAPSESASAENAQAEDFRPEVLPNEEEQNASGDEHESHAHPSWRDRVPKVFGSVSENIDTHEAAQPVEAQGETAAESENPRENFSSYGSQLGSFVIEGGDVEHEELDEDESDMPALAAHRDRYEESEPERDSMEEENGSQFGTAVRETEEDQDLEEDEYDFTGEEFEESELLADEATEEKPGVHGEEEAEPAFAPEEHHRTEHIDRRERRGRRGAPLPRGRGRIHARQQSRALPLISELLKEGQEILVQIAKEPIGKKGARITSHIALPGRFLVYMPTVNHIGVSRKISSEEERQRLKRIVSSERENGHGGFIVRTAASNIKEDELRADIRFLKHLWSEIRTRAESSKSPSLIYHDLNLVERILRDQVTSDFSQIWVDNESEYERVVRFASRFQPNIVRRIKLYTKDTPLYEQFGINDEINKSLKSKVWLKSGGYIVINQTEALVAIDINTGKYVGKTARLEDTIVKTNCDAVKEIVRQIRLRDLGGIIVVDFIDMDERKNRQKVMQALEEAMKSDRAPSKILQFNDFGLVAITRKRVKQSLERTLGTPCPYCEATGFVKSVQTVCNEIYVEMRKIRRHVESKEVIVRVNPEVAKELKANNGKWLQEMEEVLGHSVLVKSDALLHQEQFDMNY
ncbi:MAG: ribonuclease [Acidobacteria bacterium]|nr:MAG: ribonuclease [Acidobacteriota bacterium]